MPLGFIEFEQRPRSRLGIKVSAAVERQRLERLGLGKLQWNFFAIDMGNQPVLII